MHFSAVLNRHGGTLRTLDIDGFVEGMRATLEKSGHTLDVNIVEGGEIVAALKAAVNDRRTDCVIAGGGDGTISAAAGILMDTQKALGVLPVGTMNLFARSLQMPLETDKAIDCFADGVVKAVDVATADNRPFVHQFSIGLHAKMVKLRDQMEFSSKVGKIGASVRAAYRTVINPPSLKVKLTIGEAELFTRTSGIGVTNNLFGEGHLPYADHPDGGVLGVYVTVAQDRLQLLRFALNMARGRWKQNDQVEIHEAKEVGIRLLSRGKKFGCVIDGELSDLRPETQIRIHPGALKVLVPREAQTAKAA